MEIPEIKPGQIGRDHVAPDAIPFIKRQQTNPSRWKGDGWDTFVAELKEKGVDVRQGKGAKGIFVTDAGGLAYGLPHGVVRAESAAQIAELLKAAQKHKIPVTSRGGGLTTEGESVAFGGVLLDMTGMSRVKKVDRENLTVRTEAGIFWHLLAEELRRYSMDYLSSPLNLTSSVGGTLGVGGVDVNSTRFGCSADQALSMEVVTPTGEIVECSDTENNDLFKRVILGYGQFGIITEATLRIRPYTPLKMHYFYYSSLKNAVNDLVMIDKAKASHYSGILTMMDKAITLLVAFDTDEVEQEFMSKWRAKLKGHGELAFAVNTAFYYLFRPWKLKEALFLYNRKKELFPDLQPPHHMQDGKILDRTVVFSRAVWKHWGSKQMIIPDVSTNADKFAEAVEKGNKVCKKYFPHYTLYCVGIRLREDHREHYEMSCIPPDAKDIAYGCEFEPMLENRTYSRDYLQSFKNEIYDIGVELGGSYYRFGGMMKGYIRRVFGDELVDRHLEMKKKADPAMILNRDVIF